MKANECGLEISDESERNSRDACEREKPEIQRRLNRSDGVYIEGEIEGVKITFTTDTGATRTIISPSVYNCISSNRRPVLKKSVGLSSASGSPLKEYGIALFRLCRLSSTLHKKLGLKLGLFSQKFRAFVNEK